MRRSRFSLYFALALSGLVCSGSSAGAARVSPVKCYLQTQLIGFFQTVPGTTWTCYHMTGCLCAVTFCPALCRPLQPPSTQGCTFVGNCGP
jgi:hypothetical protein